MNKYVDNSFKEFYSFIEDIQGNYYEVGKDGVVAIEAQIEDNMWGHTFGIYYDTNVVTDPFDQMKCIKVDAELLR